MWMRGGDEKKQKILVCIPEGKRQLQNIGAEVRIILKRI
jgi:hypothetical protein